MTHKEISDFIGDFLYSLPNEDCIVSVAYKYSFEDSWDISNELALYEDFGHTWLNDWWEGQQDIEFRGYIPVRSVPVPKLWNLEEWSIRGKADEQP